MTGDSKRRFCEQCQLHVHNLSAMSPREVDAFVEETHGRECISYEVRADGTMITRTFWSRFAAPFCNLRGAAMAVLATVLPFLFSACANRRLAGGICPPDGKTSYKANKTVRGEAMTVGQVGKPQPPPEHRK